MFYCFILPTWNIFFLLLLLLLLLQDWHRDKIDTPGW